jgi:hypothetical protein
LEEKIFKRGRETGENVREEERERRDDGNCKVKENVSKRENIGKHFAEEKTFGSKISRGRKYQERQYGLYQNISTVKNTTTIYPSTSWAEQLLQLKWVY